MHTLGFVTEGVHIILPVMILLQGGYKIAILYSPLVFNPRAVQPKSKYQKEYKKARL